MALTTGLAGVVSRVLGVLKRNIGSLGPLPFQADRSTRRDWTDYGKRTVKTDVHRTGSETEKEP